MGLQLDGDIQKFEEAAAAGDPGALYDLGLIYSTGRDGTPGDYVIAHKWFNLAVLRGYEPALGRARRGRPSDEPRRDCPGPAAGPRMGRDPLGPRP
jgi:hypothetical protein